MTKAKQADFLRQFARAGNFDLIGNALMMRTENLTIKAVLSTSGTHKQWTGFLVTTVDRRSGEVVDKQTFRFDDFLEKEPGSRSHDFFAVIEHCAWEWYIMVPTIESVEEMVGTMEVHATMYD